MILLPDLFEFAYVPNWFDHLIALAEMAVPESWRFTNPKLPPRNTDTPILEKHVDCVFRKQIIDFNNFNYVPNPEYADRIFYVRNENVCFTTSLCTKNYKSIVGCSTRNKRKDAKAIYSSVLLLSFISHTFFFFSVYHFPLIPRTTFSGSRSGVSMVFL